MNPEKARWISSGIPPALRGLTLDMVAQMGPPTEQLAIARDWVQNLPTQQHLDPETDIPTDRRNYGRGLFFFGLPGTGKTTLAIATACQVRINYRKTVYFTRCAHFIDCLLKTMRADQHTDPEQLSRWYSVVEAVDTNHVVVLDDLGHEHRTDKQFAEHTLHELLRRRYEHGRPTILTSNLTPKQLSERYSEAFDSFTKQACRRVLLDGGSFREKP